MITGRRRRSVSIAARLTAGVALSVPSAFAAPPATLPDEAAVTGYANFSRQIRVENYPAGAFPMKTVTVTAVTRGPTAPATHRGGTR